MSDKIKVPLQILSATAFAWFLYQILWGIDQKSDAEWCGKPIPVFYENGEVAVFLKTGEHVRVVKKTTLLGGGKCQEERFSEYRVRFGDGAEVYVDWKQLSKLRDKANKG